MGSFMFKALLLVISLCLAIPTVAAADDEGAIPMGVLIAICVIVFFGTIVVILCFIQFCIKNYNPLDYCYFCLNTKKKEASSDKRLIDRSERTVRVDGGRSEMMVQTDGLSRTRQVTTEQTVNTAQQQAVNTSETTTTVITRGTAVDSEDLYTMVQKSGKGRELLVVEKIEVDGGRSQNDYVTSDVLTNESNQRERVFVHDQNIILRQKSNRYEGAFEGESEELVEGGPEPERVTYSTGYTPSTSQERLVVMDGEGHDGVQYVTETVQTTKEVRTTPSGETVVVVRERDGGQHTNMGLNIQDEENRVENVEYTQSSTGGGGVHRIIKRTVVTEEYEDVPATKVENTEYRHVYQHDTSADQEEREVNAAIQAIDQIAANEGNESNTVVNKHVYVTRTTDDDQRNYTTEERVGDDADGYNVVTKVTKVVREVPMVSGGQQYPVIDYPLEDGDEFQQGVHHRRIQSVKEGHVTSGDGQRSRKSPTRYSYHGVPPKGSKVVYVDGQPTQSTVVTREVVREPGTGPRVVYVDGQPSQSTVVTREVVTEDPGTERRIVYVDGQPSQSTVVTREIVTEQPGTETQVVYVDGQPTTYTYQLEDQDGEYDTQRTYVTTEENIVENSPSIVTTTTTTKEVHGVGGSRQVVEGTPGSIVTTTTTTTEEVRGGDYGEAYTGTDGQEVSDVTYRVINTGADDADTQTQTSSAENKDWFVSSASMVKRNPIETVYVDLGPEENFTGSKKTTTTTTYIDNVNNFGEIVLDTGEAAD